MEYECRKAATMGRIMKIRGHSLTVPNRKSGLMMRMMPTKQMTVRPR